MGKREVCSGCGSFNQNSEILEVPVSKLLGNEIKQDDTEDLTEELSRLNEQLAQKNQKENLIRHANEKRGIILCFSFVAMLIAPGISNSVIFLLLSGGCMLSAVIVLYRNLALLTSVTTEDVKTKILRVTTMINLLVLVLVISLAALMAAGVIRFSESEEKISAMLLVAGIMIFSGIISPKLPFTRHTGLRLPWTIRDQDTWNVAHRILGYISLPLSLLYIACALTGPYFKEITLVAILLWIGIPGGISYIFYWKKTHGRL